MTPSPLAPTLPSQAPPADQPVRLAPAGSPLPTLKRRQPRWILAGVLALALGALGSVLLWTRVADTATVLRVDRTLHRGDVLTAQDLSPVSVGQLGDLATVSSEDLDSVLGQQVRTDVVEGSLLSPQALGRPELAAGVAVVGLRLDEGRVPRVSLEPGTTVLLVETAPAQPTGQDAEPGQRSFRAEVHRPTEAGSDQVAVLVDVTVDRRDAEAVARLAAEDRIVLVRSE